MFFLKSEKTVKYVFSNTARDMKGVYESSWLHCIGHVAAGARLCFDQRREQQSCMQRLTASPYV